MAILLKISVTFIGIIYIHESQLLNQFLAETW